MRAESAQRARRKTREEIRGEASSRLSPRPLRSFAPVLRFRSAISRALVIREFKKLRRQLQRKRHIKIELCVKLSVLRLFRVYHVVQNRRTALSLAWHEWFS